MLHIIYSKEPSTIFLSEVVKILKEKFTEKVLVFEYDDLAKSESVYNFIAQIPNEAVVLFLGHGASHRLYGPLDLNGERSNFITNENYHVLTNKKIVCLSCNSNQLLKKIQVSFGIGFGDLPSDWNHVIGIREFEDANALQGIDENILMKFVTLINHFVVMSTSEYLEKALSFDAIFHRFKLHINLEINKLILEKNDGDKVLLNLLFQMKDEMKLFK